MEWHSGINTHKYTKMSRLANISKMQKWIQMNNTPIDVPPLMMNSATDRLYILDTLPIIHNLTTKPLGIRMKRNHTILARANSNCIYTTKYTHIYFIQDVVNQPTVSLIDYT